jgi:hypothetical protein
MRSTLGKRFIIYPVSSMNSKTDLKQTVDFNSEENDPSF